jgi:hypothetical protein
MTAPSSIYRKGTTKSRREARNYYDLCDEARALGILVSLDDPDSPPTVAALRNAVEAARLEDKLSRGGLTTDEMATLSWLRLTCAYERRHA